MKQEPVRLPDAELAVMQAVWSAEPPVSRTEVGRALAQTRPMAPTTVLTLLSRLTARGALRAEKSGRSYLYTPAFSRTEYLAAQERRFFGDLCGGDLRVFAAALCDSGLSRADIDELSRLLEAGEL